MGRKIPVGENPSIHPFISLSLFVACIAATITIISSLCGLARKKPPPPPATETKTENSVTITTPPHTESPPPPPTTETVEPDKTTDTQNEEMILQQPLPPPPGMSHMRAASCHVRSDSMATTRSSQGKLPSSLSMRVLGGGIGALRQGSKREDKKLKHEDSIWKKQIILGEKCKVPDEEEDTILYDEKGNRISTYHKKKPTASLPVSRQSSDIDQDAIPG